MQACYVTSNTSDTRLVCESIMCADVDASTSNHPVRKFVIDFLRRIVFDSLSVTSPNKSTPVIDVILEVIVIVFVFLDSLISLEMLPFLCMHQWYSSLCYIKNRSYEDNNTYSVCDNRSVSASWLVYVILVKLCQNRIIYVSKVNSFEQYFAILLLNQVLPLSLRCSQKFDFILGLALVSD